MLLHLGRPLDVAERGLVFVQNFLQLLAEREAAGQLRPWFKEVGVTVTIASCSCIPVGVHKAHIVSMQHAVHWYRTLELVRKPGHPWVEGAGAHNLAGRVFSAMFERVGVLKVGEASYCQSQGDNRQAARQQ